MKYIFLIFFFLVFSTLAISADYAIIRGISNGHINVSIVDRETMSEVASISLPGDSIYNSFTLASDLIAIDYDRWNNNVYAYIPYVDGNHSVWVAQIDLRIYQIVRSFELRSLGGNAPPADIAITPNRQFLLTSCAGNKTVYVTDLSTLYTMPLFGNYAGSPGIPDRQELEILDDYTAVYFVGGAIRALPAGSIPVAWYCVEVDIQSMSIRGFSQVYNNGNSYESAPQDFKIKDGYGIVTLSDGPLMSSSLNNWNFGFGVWTRGLPIANFTMFSIPGVSPPLNWPPISWTANEISADNSFLLIASNNTASVYMGCIPGFSIEYNFLFNGIYTSVDKIAMDILTVKTGIFMSYQDIHTRRMGLIFINEYGRVRELSIGMYFDLQSWRSSDEKVIGAETSTSMNRLGEIDVLNFTYRTSPVLTNISTVSDIKTYTLR